MTVHIALKLDECSDAALVRRFARKRDEEAFAELLRRYQGLVSGVCRRSLSNSCDVEDAVQATFATLARNVDRIRNPSSVSSWLHGVAFRTATRLRGKQDRTETLNEPDSLTGSCTEPFEEIATRQQIAIVDQQLNSLPDKYRTPLVLFHFADQSTQQIASQLGLTATAVEGRLKRGRQRLKRVLAGRGLLFPAMFASMVPSEAVSSSACCAGGRGLSFPGQTLRIGGTSMFTKSLATAAVLGLTTLGIIAHVPPREASQSAYTTQTTRSSNTTAGAPEVVTIEADETGRQTPAEALHQQIHDKLHEAHVRLYNFLVSLHG